MGLRAVPHLILLAGGASASQHCADGLAWSAGKPIPFDHATLQRSIANIGDPRRLAPVLTKLSLNNATAKVLVIGSSVETGGCFGCEGYLWQDVFAAWLRRTFPAQLSFFELHVSGPLSHHLQTLPSAAERLRPDLVLVETSLNPLLEEGWKGTAKAQTPKYLVDEELMRALLLLPGSPALVWVDLMAGEKHHSNQLTDKMLVQYYDVPQVSVRDAWQDWLPFDEGDLWDSKPERPSLLGHKVIAATVVNFLCFEFLQTCQKGGGFSMQLPKPLFSVTTVHSAENRSNAAAPSGAGPLEAEFCAKKPIIAAEPENGGEIAGPRSESEDHSWVLAVALSMVPVVLFHIAASFVGVGGWYLQCNLPQRMPELELLRVVATVNLVAFRYYDTLPPAWAQPAPEGGELHAAGLDCSWCEGGRYCFQFFFLIAGFLLMLSGVRQGTTNAVWQYAQVWPLHAFGLLLAVASGPAKPLDLALTASLMHAWVTPFHSALNGASWYLSALLAFWIVTPIWVRALDRLAALRGAKGLLLALLAAWLCTLLLPFLLHVWPVRFGLREMDPQVNMHNFVKFSPYANWQPFLIGMLLACLAMTGVELRSKAAVALSLVLALAGLAVAWFVVPSAASGESVVYLLLDKGFALQPFFALLLFGAMGSRRFPNPLHRLLTGGPTLFLAKLCWPMFILHEPVHRFCVKFLFPSLGRESPACYGSMVLYPLVLVAAALCASQVIDQPWARLLYKCRKSGGQGGAQQAKPLAYEELGRENGDGERGFRDVRLIPRR